MAHESRNRDPQPSQRIAAPPNRRPEYVRPDQSLQESSTGTVSPRLDIGIVTADDPSPTADAIPPQAIRSWLGLHFTGLQPVDQNASLFRRWVGKLTGLRSDGTLIEVRLAFLQNDSPYQVSDTLSCMFDALETYRDCSCMADGPCDLHADLASGGPVTTVVSGGVRHAATV